MFCFNPGPCKTTVACFIKCTENWHECSPNQSIKPKIKEHLGTHLTKSVSPLVLNASATKSTDELPGGTQGERTVNGWHGSEYSCSEDMGGRDPMDVRAEATLDYYLVKCCLKTVRWRSKMNGTMQEYTITKRVSSREYWDGSTHAKQ